MGRRLALLALVVIGCDQTAPSCPEMAPSASERMQDESRVILPDPARSVRPSASLHYPEKPSYEPPPNVPRFIPEGKNVWGFGVLQVAITPTRKASEDKARSLRSLLIHYEGQDWNPHLTIVPWFGTEQTLVFQEVWPESAEAMCEWLHRIGWRAEYGDGIPGVRTCKYHRTWYPEKP